MVKYRIKIISTLFLCYILLGTALPVYAQEEIGEPAEVVAKIDTQDNRIPSIKVSEWTKINVTVTDVFGIPWEELSTGRYRFMAKYLWPIIHPSWRPFLGYSSLRFEPEIIEGDSRGWFTKITPNAITEADQGKIYNLTLEVKTDDIAVDYAVVVGIKVTRVDVFGADAGQSYIYIPVKASSLNNVKMDTMITTKEVAPHSKTFFDVTVRNRGYYRDIFQLEFIKDDDVIVATSKQLFVLDPDDSQSLRIEVLTPESFYDFGTPYTIEIYATSASDPNQIHVGTVVVITKGLHISPLIGIMLSPIIIILVLIYFIFFYLKQKRDQELFGKPEKPWNIPIEKRHLEELKQKDKEAYEKERLMMEDEYKSALLWYEDHRQSIIRQEKQKGKTKQFNSKVNGFFKKPENNQKKTEEEKPIKKQKQPKKEKKPVKKIEKPIQKEEKPTETPEIIKEQYKAIKIRSAESERKKQIALEKIKRAQEKQKKKMK